MTPRMCVCGGVGVVGHDRWGRKPVQKQWLRFFFFFAEVRVKVSCGKWRGSSSWVRAGQQRSGRSSPGDVKGELSNFLSPWLGYGAEQSVQSTAIQSRDCILLALRSQNQFAEPHPFSSSLGHMVLLLGPSPVARKVGRLWHP